MHAFKYVQPKDRGEHSVVQRKRTHAIAIIGHYSHIIKTYYFSIWYNGHCLNLFHHNWIDTLDKY